MGSVDALKAFSPGLIQALGSGIVAVLGSDCIQGFEGDTGLEVAGGVGQGLQLLSGVLRCW